MKIVYIILMYRQSNQRFSDNNPNIKNNNYPFPPEHSMPKMPSDPFPPINSMPLYDYSNNNYQYINNNNPGPPDNFQRPYPPSWRQVSQPKNSMMPSMGPSPPLHSVGSVGNNQFDVRPMHGGSNDIHQHSKNDMPAFIPNNPPPPGGSIPNAPQMNVVQRISGIVKSQLSVLQGILSYVDKKTAEQRMKKDRSRSRSRDRGQRNRSGGHKEWNCSKCNYYNFDFRDKCKKCNESKPVERQQRHGGFKNYVPGPQDWRCNKCNNINYARRTECHRCHTAKGK